MAFNTPPADSFVIDLSSSNSEALVRSSSETRVSTSGMGFRKASLKDFRAVEGSSGDMALRHSESNSQRKEKKNSL